MIRAKALLKRRSSVRLYGTISQTAVIIKGHSLSECRVFVYSEWKTTRYRQKMTASVV
jgi:hypothetical protein